MSIEDDVALLDRIPTLRVLGIASLRMLAIGSDIREIEQGDTLFQRGDVADAGFVVQRGSFRLSSADQHEHEVVAGQGTCLVQVLAGPEQPARSVDRKNGDWRYQGPKYRVALFASISFSSAVSGSSTIFSMPLPPSTTGTPM